jgi:hypothetical protein
MAATTQEATTKPASKLPDFGRLFISEVRAEAARQRGRRDVRMPGLPFAIATNGVRYSVVLSAA